MSFIADDLGAWLVALLADAGSKKLVTLVLGDEQERALREAARNAIRAVAAELRPEGGERAGELAMVVDQVFGDPAPDKPLGAQVTMLEWLQDGVARRLAVLDDAGITGTGQSSAELLGLPGSAVAEKLTGCLVQQIMVLGSHGGALAPLAAQLNHDVTHLQGQRLEGMVDRLATQVAAGRPLRIAVVAGAAYLQQVRRIAPPDPPGLVGREVELAELAAFCCEPGRGPYAWWRARAWAGKSALLSTFVLRPPPGVASQVTIVSFFITSRLAAQDTRDAFTEVLLGQLAELTGQDLPAALPEATREGYLLELLALAAGQCQDAGGRLVLVVDGLDEDRGATGPGAHSIAGLLPTDLSAGMRVIVTSRPDPPLLDDVPSWHPLRDPAIIRSLETSPYARDVERLARQELQRLLHGTPAEQDILGLLTAARGGLSAADLEELTDAPPWEIDGVLRAAATGRTFTSRPGQLAGTSPDVYLLGHEELQQAARRSLGQRRLDGYQQQLHDWAGDWLDRGWPPGTPGYLLIGYNQLLADLGDVGRMTVLASDAARHDRMLKVTGGDAAALAEIRAALDKITTQDTPDLAAALHLAWHRDQLSDRNTNISASLPAVWASLGNTIRAIALANSLPDLNSRAEALARVAGALADAGQQQRAAALISDAVQVARSISDPSRQVDTLTQVAEALVDSGQHQLAATIASDAEQVARSIGHLDSRAGALAHAAKALADAGQHQRAVTLASDAEQAARSIVNPLDQALALVRVAEALVGAGQHQRAVTLASDAEQATRSIVNPRMQALALVWVAEALVGAGQHQRAEQIARSISDPFDQAQALAKAAGALVGSGQHQSAVTLASDAEQAARSISDPYRKGQALARVVEALADAGQHQRAEQIARSISHSDWQAQALAHVVEALAGAGQHQRAEQIARSISHPDSQARALAHVAEALASAGQHQHAATLAGDAEQVARSSSDSYRQVQGLAQAAETLADAGQHQQAEQAARSISSRYWQARALAEVAGALAGAGQRQHAAALASDVEQAARSISDPYSQADLAEALAEAGQHQQAEQIACSISDPGAQARAMAKMAAALAEAGQHQQAEHIARSISDLDWQARALAEVAEAVADAGQLQQAEQIARSISCPDSQARALAEVAEALVGAGQHQQAAALASDAEQAARSISDPYQQSWVLAQVARPLASAGQLRQVEQIARSISDPESQAHALADLAEALASAGQLQQAEQIARSISNPYQASALARVATVLASAGQYQQVEQVTRLISHSEGDSELAEIAKMLASVGQLQQAEQIARSISEPYWQAWSLATVAIALSLAGRTADARRLASLACAAGRWTASAAPVLMLDPSAWATVDGLLDKNSALGERI